MTARPPASPEQEGAEARKGVPDYLSGNMVVVPGSTGGIGEGIVRAYLRAGADVVVSTGSTGRAQEFQQLLRDVPLCNVAESGGHFPMLEVPASFAREVQQALGPMAL